MISVPSLPEPVPVDLGGVRAATYVLDGGSVGDVVLCHGTPWQALVWAEVGRRLAEEGWRVHLWDMPGYGRSPKEAGVPVDLASQMGRFAELLGHWGLARPHVVAHDIGGAVSLGAHLLHGRGYASLHLWDVVTLDPWASPFFALVRDHADVFGALPERLSAALVREYVAGAAGRALSPEWLDALAEPWRDEGQAGFYRQVAQATPDHTRPLVERLGEVRCRTAVGWGEADPWIPVEQAGRLTEALPGDVPVRLLPGVGHLAPVEAPDEVFDAVREFLG